MGDLISKSMLERKNIIHMLYKKNLFNNVNSLIKSCITKESIVKGEKNLLIPKVFVGASMVASMSIINPKFCNADISGLTPCSESKAINKRKSKRLKELTNRMKKFESDSAPQIALRATMERTERRFEKYSQSGLLCGTDGLPHLIADPGFAIKNGHSTEILLPTFGFLYFAGWIGHSGRLYLERTKSKEKEIIIDVPLAFACLGKAVVWPGMVVADLITGTLLEKDSNITVSPR